PVAAGAGAERHHAPVEDRHLVGAQRIEWRAAAGAARTGARFRRLRFEGFVHGRRSSTGSNRPPPCGINPSPPITRLTAAPLPDDESRMEGTMPEFVHPNLYQLQGKHLHVSYSTSGFDGRPHFTYQDAHQNLNFAGDDIRTVQTEIGTLVTVTIRR